MENGFYYMFFDGLSSPNPGEISYASIIYDENRNIILEVGKYESYGTNNEAEYKGLILGLKSSLKKGIRKLIIHGDSKLVISQVLGIWKVRNEKLYELNKKVEYLLGKLEDFEINHVNRKFNNASDELTKEVLRKRKGFLRLY